MDTETTKLKLITTDGEFIVIDNFQLKGNIEDYEIIWV